MVRMVADSELAFDHLGNARRAPQIGPVTLRRRSLQSRRISRFLSERSVRGTAGEKRTCRAPAPPSAGIPPAHHRTGIAPNPAAHLMERVARVQQCQRASPPVLQKTGASLQPGIGILNLNTHYCIIYAGVNSGGGAVAVAHP